MPPPGSSQPPRRLGDRAEQRTALAHRLLPLLHGVGVVDDAGAGLHVQAAALDPRGADRDPHVGLAVPAPVTDPARVPLSLDPPQLPISLPPPVLYTEPPRVGYEFVSTCRYRC